MTLLAPCVVSGARDWTSLALVHLNTKISVYSGCSVMNELA